MGWATLQSFRITLALLLPLCQSFAWRNELLLITATSMDPELIALSVVARTCSAQERVLTTLNVGLNEVATTPAVDIDEGSTGFLAGCHNQTKLGMVR